MLVLFITILLSICFSVFLSSIIGGTVYAMDEETNSPSPISCEVDWSESEWKPCDQDKCTDKGDQYTMYQYRTGTIKRAAKHGGRECPDLTEYKNVVSSLAADDDTVVSSLAADDDTVVSSPAADDDTVVSSPAADSVSSPAADSVSSPAATDTYSSPIPINNDYYMLPKGETCPTGKGELTTIECIEAWNGLGGNVEEYLIEPNYGTYSPASLLSCAIKSGSTNWNNKPWVIYTVTTVTPNNEIGNVAYAPICKY